MPHGTAAQTTRYIALNAEQAASRDGTQRSRRFRTPEAKAKRSAHPLQRMQSSHLSWQVQHFVSLKGLKDKTSWRPAVDQELNKLVRQELHRANKRIPKWTSPRLRPGRKPRVQGVG